MGVPLRIGAVEDAQQHGKGGALGGRRHQANDRGRRALVDVGRPDLEGRGETLKPMPIRIMAKATMAKRRRALGKRGGDVGNIGGAGSAKDQGDAVEKEGGGEGTEQEVLEGRFRTLAVALAKAGQDVGGDGRNFQADEDQQQLNRAWSSATCRRRRK